jgi:hypothetical protein
MTTQIKTGVLTGLFVFSLLSGIKAQDRYEFAVIDYFPSRRNLEISINGVEYKRIDVDKNDVKGDGDVNAALKEISKMNKEGWDVFNTTTVAGQTSGIKSYVFYLRKKIS